MITTQTKLFTEIENVITTLTPNSISKERKAVLAPLVTFIQSKVNNSQEIRLNFICTHNSRRSHLSQIWAQTLAFYFNIQNVFCYSGGTESTALFPIVAKTLQHSGFHIATISENINPIYTIKYAENAHPIIGFSKKFDDHFNPVSDFAAVMTCSQADEGCPFITGAQERIPITYEDPKKFDHTELQAEKYHERSLQIATELCYVFSQIRKLNS